MINNKDGRELPGYKKKSFSMFYGGGEIWFEHLDGMKEYSGLAVEKLKADFQQLKKPSMPSLVAFNIDETVIDEKISDAIYEVLSSEEKNYRKVVFVGTSFISKHKLLRRIKTLRLRIEFINDFEKAKEWLIH